MDGQTPLTLAQTETGDRGHVPYRPIWAHLVVGICANPQPLEPLACLAPDTWHDAIATGWRRKHCLHYGIMQGIAFSRRLRSSLPSDGRNHC
nr:hypothetical protein [Mesorhizobium kowhaii]